MSTTEQKAKELASALDDIADHDQSGRHQELRESAAELRRLSAENEALLADAQTYQHAREALALENAELATQLATQKGELATLRAQVEALTKDLADANDSAAWHKRRTSLLQRLQSTMQEPERTIVCDVLANGHLLQGPDGQPDKQRYAPQALTRPAVPEIDYPELISACYRITKRPQGTPGCVHFKAGAEWFRSVMLAAAPQPEVQANPREQHDADSRELRSLCAARDEAWRERDNLRSKLDDLEIKNASLESEVFHLSTLCDEQRAILVDVEMDFGTDAHGIMFEDGDSKLIDRVRAHLAMLAQPQPQPEATIKESSRVAQPT